MSTRMTLERVRRGMGVVTFGMSATSTGLGIFFAIETVEHGLPWAAWIIVASLVGFGVYAYRIALSFLGLSSSA